MPLFRNNHDAAATEAPRTSTHTSTRHSTSTASSESPRRSFFSRRRSASISPDRATTTTSATTRSSKVGSLLGRRHEDPSIANAKERVARAEAAEREADQALAGARLAVREAREHVAALEREAAEEARLAKIKQHEAKNISKRARPLGRHD